MTDITNTNAERKGEKTPPQVYDLLSARIAKAWKQQQAYERLLVESRTIPDRYPQEIINETVRLSEALRVSIAKDQEVLGYLETNDEVREYLAKKGSGYTNGTGPEETGEGPPEIKVSADLPAMVDAAEEALIGLPSPIVYQRSRQLVRIAPAGQPPKWLQRPPQSPIIAHADLAYLRELSSRSVRWTKVDKRSKATSTVLPPTVVFETLAARLAWRFPPLEGIVCAPTLRPDGKLLQTAGYDESTGLFFDFNGTTFPPIPEEPTQRDAIDALDTLNEPFVDFPFAETFHNAAAIAGVLTLVGRFAIGGRVPAFPVRAHSRGTGKGLLINTIAVIGTGRTAPTWTQTTDEAEENKRLLSIAMAGDTCLHIDNVLHPFGSGPLDSVITTDAISGRILGHNETRELPWKAVIFASGNNMTFRGDMIRRVVPIDLDAKSERPEEREGFTHVPLLDWVSAERPRFVAAALTMLKAYFNAGCPKTAGIPEYGSFEPWSDLIRHGLLWCNWPDPCAGRKDLEETSDPVYENLATLLQCWENCYADGKARTLAVVTQDATQRRIDLSFPTAEPNEWNELFDALRAYDDKYDGKRLDTTRIGNALRVIEGRVLDDVRLIREGEYRRAATWKIDRPITHTG